MGKNGGKRVERFDLALLNHLDSLDDGFRE